MALCQINHHVSNPSPQNYYFKASVAYTEDHIPVQKIYMYGVPPQLKYKVLKAHFAMYGHVVRLQIFKPKNVGRGGRRLWQTGYVFYATKKDAAKALHSRVHHLDGLKFHVQASDSWHQPEAYGTYPCLPLPNTEPPPPALVMSLNDHCLEYVMAYLKLPDQIHFARTCLRFRAVYEMATARLHKSIDLIKFEEMTVWDMRDFFRLSGVYVETVYGVMPGKNAPRLCDFLADSCRNLKTMNLFSHRNLNTMIMSVHTMYKMFANKSQLESLMLPMANICDRRVLALRNLRKLKALNLSANPLTGDTLAKLPCTIESLTLDDCRYMEIRYLMKVLKTFHWLKELNIKGIDPYGLQIYEQIIKDKSCKALETLGITGYGHIRYEFVAQIPNLKHLSVYIPRLGLRGELFEQLAEHKATKLECLEVVGDVNITKEMLFNIAKLRELQRLTLPRIDREAALVDAFGGSSNRHQKLEKFILTKLCVTVGNQAILKVFGACRRLSYIGLGDCTELNEELALGIVSRVQQEIANKDMHRKLPIELCLYKKIENHSDKIPKDIIQIKSTYDPDSALRFDDDYSFDPDDLDLDELEDTDDDEFENDMYDMGFLSTDDDDDEDFYLGGAGGYVHPSWPYDENGDFVGFGLDSD